MSDTMDEDIEQVTRASATWAAMSLRERAEAMRGVAAGLDSAADHLVPLAMAETHLREARLRGELKRTTFQLRLFADTVEEGAFLEVRMDRPDAQWPMGAHRPDLRRMLVPIGPVLVFSAGNFPFAFSVAGGDTAAAWAAGNAVLVKAHPGHPRLSDATAEVVARSLAAAGAPQHLLRVIHGKDAGVAALKHPSIKAASFTGSIEGGRALFDIAAARPEPIPFYGELGSVNPAFVLPAASTARPQDIAASFLAAVTGSQGQLCTKPGVLLVPAGSPIIEELEQIDVAEGAPLLNLRTSEVFLSTLGRVSEHPGITVLRDGPESRAEAPELTLLRTDVEEVLTDVEGFLTEMFGPAALIVEYGDPADAVRLARELPGQLTATLIGEDEVEGDLELSRELLPILCDRAGRLLWNEWPTGVSVTHAQQHGGPYPATTAPTTTAVGPTAISRFLRPVVYQNFPLALLPGPLLDENPLGVPQHVHG
ncbi:aldehyde dehydrogenase family protein [Nesterenkonia sp. Act20]|uniref:aldehyde dehydrogenase family protein n=1 Tax=Nesterenkonia sp. Act20 TaxID=1483432 RepID=UPI001C484AFD|nr:aldehyde dehydrogenase family protein [Nesterenkonia sp. Act20]